VYNIKISGLGIEKHVFVDSFEGRAKLLAGVSYLRFVRSDKYDLEHEV
jgi:hypothetical protein